MKKKTIVLLLALALFTTFITPVQAMYDQENEAIVRAYSTSTPKGLLLYVGYTGNGATDKYPTYSQSDITNLSTATSEFILCTGNAMYNYYKFGNSSTKQIITESLINNLSSSLVNNPANLAQIKADYLSILNGTRALSESSEESHIEDLFGHLDPSRHSFEVQSPYYSQLFGNLDPIRHRPDGNDPYAPLSYAESRAANFFTLDDLVTDVVNQVNTITLANPNATIWLPFPHIAFPSLAAQFTTPYTQYVNELKNRLGTKWTNNVRGFYWGTESVEQYYTPFNYSSTAANGFGNPMVQLMNSMDTLLSGYSKQFLWIPYLGETETLKRNGYVANRTNIFDYAVFQAGYYFNNNTTNYNNLGLIKKSVLNNKLYNRSNAVIGSSKSGTTTIGYEMEIDSLITQQTYNDRYWEYTNQYSTLKAYPCVFYAGDRNSICGTDSGATTCFYYVKTWLAS